MQVQLAPCWATDGSLDALGAQWRQRRAVRLEPVFPEHVAVSLLQALRTADYLPMQQPMANESYQLWRYAWQPCQRGCDHAPCELGRWLWTEGLAMVRRVSGLPLQPAADLSLVADQTRKGSYFDAYDDGGEGRSVALLLHLSTATWPARYGGHVEALTARDGDVVARWAPAWNALDLVDVREPGAWRQMPVVTEHVEGITVAGWFYSAT